MAHPGGPPSKLSGETLNEAAAYVEPFRRASIAAATTYIKTFVDRQSTDTSTDEHYPTIEGLALKLDVSRSTIYQWASDNKKFAKIVIRLLNKQAAMLQNLGLSKKYDSGMARLLLSKHGYVPKSETDGTIKFDPDGKAKGYMEGDGPSSQQESD